MGDASMIHTRIVKRNPYPGVRPYSSSEDKYFFGRDEAMADLLDKLLKNRFVALVGASGSGKTSLIQSGIIPSLLSDKKQEWVPVSLRPGRKPVENLLRAFQQVFPNKLTESDVQSFLNGYQKLGDLINEKGLGSHNYFLVVDQFEDLFISHSAVTKKKNLGKNQEIRRFIDLLMQAVTHEKPGIYVMLSIRSDFIDYCSLYRTLNEQMNVSKYLLPQMSRDSLAKAILGPIGQCGASVEPGFEEYILEDLEEVETPLPMMQHALMRTWDHWIQQGDLNNPVAISNYQAIGTLRNALSKNLEEAYEELTSGQKIICEHLFKSITFRGENHEGFSRQTTPETLARIAQCTIEEVIDVAEVFRKPGRAFLSTNNQVALKPDSLIELSHEALIGIWDRLKKWVDEEADSISMYLKLSKASALYQQGRTELWVPPDLQHALRWRDRQKPTPAWGIQYDPAFERAMVFLNASEEEYNWNERRKIILLRRKRALHRSIAVFAGVVGVVLVVVFLTNRNNPPVAEQSQDPVEQEYTYIPRTPPAIPEEQAGAIEKNNKENQPEASTEATEITAPEPVDRNQSVGENVPPGERVPVKKHTPAKENVSVNGQNRRNRRTPAKPATSAGHGGTTPVKTTSAVSGQRILSLARDVAVESMEIKEDPDLQGLLAYQAYKFNTQYNGRYYEADIYNGLYLALKKLISPAYNIYPSIRSAVKDMQWLSRTGSFMAVSSDGSMKILSGNISNRASQIALEGTGLNNECLSISPDERLAAVGTNGGGLLFVELENNGRVVGRSADGGKIILFLQNLGSSGSFISAGTENRIVKWEYGSKTGSTLLTTPGRPSALAASNKGKVAFGTRDGKIYELDVNDPANSSQISDFGRNHAKALAYSPGGQYLVAGLLDGTIQVFTGSGHQRIATLRGPGARVTDLAYSPDGRFLAAASYDGKVYLWNTSNLGNPPMVFSENNGFVLSVCFNGNSGYFYSGSVDYPRLIGRPSEPAQMVADFCSLVKRNLTKAEWIQYFGKDIPYEKSCPGLNE